MNSRAVEPALGLTCISASTHLIEASMVGLGIALLSRINCASVPPGCQKGKLQRNAQLVPSLAACADDLDVRRLEGIEPGQMAAVGRDGEDLNALTLGQELMFVLRHADSRPQ